MRSIGDKNLPLFLRKKLPRAITSVRDQIDTEAFLDAAIKQKAAMGDGAPKRPSYLPYKNLVRLDF